MQLHDEEFENINPGEVRVLIEEGIWPAEYLNHERVDGRYRRETDF